MKNFKIISIVIFFLGLLAVFTYTVKTEQVKGVSSQNEYQQLINKYYPSYRIMDINELDQLARAFVKKHYPNLNPSLVVDDFDGNGFTDFAFLLTDKEGKNKKTVFVILLQLSANNFKHSFILDMNYYRLDIAIAPIAKNTILSQAEAITSQKEKVLLQNPAIQLIYIGKSAVVYYWDKNKSAFCEIWTSD